MKIFLDTNIWLRFFLKDIPEQFTVVEDLLSNIDNGSFTPYTSTIVLLEIYFIFKKVYKQSDAVIIDIFQKILTIRGITLIEKTDFPNAFQYYQSYHVKLADCLIASQIPSKTTLITFDREFQKIKELTVFEPKDILRKLS